MSVGDREIRFREREKQAGGWRICFAEYAGLWELLTRKIVAQTERIG